MIDTLLNLLFRCSHRRLTRPVSPISKAGQPHSQAYVVCLDCGKQFEYDLREMRIGKPIDRSHDHAVVPRGAQQRGGKMKYAVMAAIPAAMFLGAAMRGGKKKPDTKAENQPAEPKPEPTGRSKETT